MKRGCAFCSFCATYILDFPYYHVITDTGMHMMINGSFFGQVDSLKAKLFEKLEQSLEDLQLKTEEITNVLENSNDPTNLATTNDVSGGNNYYYFVFYDGSLVAVHVHLYVCMFSLSISLSNNQLLFLTSNLRLPFMSLWRLSELIE